jgi:putative oxidoreductase
MPDAMNAALLALRLVAGVVFLAHGVKHFVNREKTIRWTQSIGFRSPRTQWFFMTFAEIGVGLGLAAGLLTSVAVAGAIGILFVAFWTVHRDAGFWVSARPDEGYEYVLTLAVVGLAVALTGPGEWSLDHALDIADDMDGAVGAVIAAAGLAAGALQLLIFYGPSQAD